jgi:hypothetical protein
MKPEYSKFELWRECNWRCEWWTVAGQSEVRLYLDGHQVGALAAGAQLDLVRQTDEWLIAVLADRRLGRTRTQHARVASHRLG